MRIRYGDEIELMTTQKYDISIDKYIVDGENGYLSAPNDVEEFSKKIDGVFADYETAKRVGMRGKELVYNEFNYNVQTKHVVEQLEKLV